MPPVRISLGKRNDDMRASSLNEVSMNFIVGYLGLLDLCYDTAKTKEMILSCWLNPASHARSV
jgi:hypothetical protein